MVHVGLEMLLSVISNSDPTSPVITIDRSTADFVKDMFFSSESAINFLNDLLQYENIEAGIYSIYAFSTANVKSELKYSFLSCVYGNRNFPPLVQHVEHG